MENEKKTPHRGGYRGGGRKKLSESGRKQVQFSLQQDEVDLIKQAAEAAGLNSSRFVVQCVKFWIENN